MECRSVKLFCACTFNLFHLLFVVVLVAVVLCCCGGGSVMVLLNFFERGGLLKQVLVSLVRGLQTNKFDRTYMHVHEIYLWVLQGQHKAKHLSFNLLTVSPLIKVNSNRVILLCGKGSTTHHNNFWLINFIEPSVSMVVR